jgi:hypothetical protein
MASRCLICNALEMIEMATGWRYLNLLIARRLSQIRTAVDGFDGHQPQVLRRQPESRRRHCAARWSRQHSAPRNEPRFVSSVHAVRKISWTVASLYIGCSISSSLDSILGIVRAPRGEIGRVRRQTLFTSLPSYRPTPHQSGISIQPCRPNHDVGSGVARKE